MNAAPAPSLSGDALPAVTVPSLENAGRSFASLSVTVPSLENAGRSFASLSAELSGRMPSSRSRSTSPTGTTQS